MSKYLKKNIIQYLLDVQLMLLVYIELFKKSVLLLNG